MTKYIIVFALLPVLLIAGCQSKNRFSTYGSEILFYEGDTNVLANCCSAAMSCMADDLKQAMQLDATPSIKSGGKSFSDKTQGTLSNRSTMSLCVDDNIYKIEIIQAGRHPSIVVLDYPPNDYRLVNHLTKLLANFEVKLVDGGIGSGG